MHAMVMILVRLDANVEYERAAFAFIIPICLSGLNVCAQGSGGNVNDVIVRSA